MKETVKSIQKNEKAIINFVESDGKDFTDAESYAILCL